MKIKLSLKQINKIQTILNKGYQVELKIEENKVAIIRTARKLELKE